MLAPNKAQKKVAILMYDWRLMKYVIENALLEGNKRITETYDALDKLTEEQLDQRYYEAVEALNTMAKSGASLGRKIK